MNASDTIATLTRVLHHEARTGFQDSAVVGVLESFVVAATH